MGKEQTGDPLDLRMNTGFVLVANNRIAFPMPEVATAVHVFGPLPNRHSVGDFHRPAFSAQPAPSFPMAPRELLPQSPLALRLIIDVLVNGLMVDVLLRWSYPFVDLFPQSSRDLLGRPAKSQLSNGWEPVYSRMPRNWAPVGPVWLNPERDTGAFRTRDAA